MDIKISPRLNSVLEYAREEAMRTGSYAIAVDHLTLGILRDKDNDACRTMAGLGICLGDLKDFIDSRVFCDKSVPYYDSEKVGVSRGVENVINMAALEALKAGVQEVSTSHLLLAIVRMSGNAGKAFLTEFGITPEMLSQKMKASGMLSSGARTVTPSSETIAHLVTIPEADSKTFS